MSRDLERTFAGLPASAPVRRFEEHRWVHLLTPRGAVVVGTRTALARTRTRWAAGGAGVVWLGGIGAAHAAGLTVVSWAMVAVVALAAVPLMARCVREAWPSRARLVLRERDRAARLAYARAAGPPPEGNDAADTPPPTEPPAEGPRYGAAWRDRRAITGERLPKVRE